MSYQGLGKGLGVRLQVAETKTIIIKRVVGFYYSEQVSVS